PYRPDIGPVDLLNQRYSPYNNYRQRIAICTYSRLSFYENFLWINVPFDYAQGTSYILRAERSRSPLLLNHYAVFSSAQTASIKSYPNIVSLTKYFNSGD